MSIKTMKKRCIDCKAIVLLVFRPKVNSKPTRCRSCAQRERWKNPNDKRRAKLVGRNKSQRFGHCPYEDREWLRVRYEDMLMSIEKIAKEAHCGSGTIGKWMAHHKIATRPPDVAMQLVDRSGSKNGNWKGGVNLRCPLCGCLKRPARHYQLCMACRAKQQIGEGNGNWKGYADVTTLLRTWIAAHWRPLVFERDKFQCQSCGDKRGGNLNAHHIRQLAHIISEKAVGVDLKTATSRLAFIKQLTTDPEITDINNGITLCELCHGILHNKHLTLENAREIRRQKAEEGLTNVALGRRHRVSSMLIGLVIRNKIWKDVTAS